jgi:hypothetical protein
MCYTHGPARVTRTATTAAFVALLCACGDSNTTPTTPTTPTSPTTTGCEVKGASYGGIIDPNGPFYHQVVVAETDDGVTLRDAHEVLDHASVPDGTRLADGSIAIYYVNGAENGLWVARLSGGFASPLGPISLNGISNPAGVVDPDATTLPGGRVRLVYLNGLAQASQPRTMCVAESSDAVNFQVVGPAITFTGTQIETDPSVTELLDGSWLMAISRGQRSVMARSVDGLTFTAFDTLGYGGVPEVRTLADGRVRLYVCAGGIESYLSADQGRSWTREATVVSPGTLGKRIVCDPSMVAGTNVFVFKTGT